MAKNVPSRQNNNKTATFTHETKGVPFPVSETRCLASERSFKRLDLVFDLPIIVMDSSSKPSTSYASIVRGSSSDSQDEGNFSLSWLHRFQRVSEEEALSIALEESIRVSINVTLLFIIRSLNKSF